MTIKKFRFHDASPNWILNEASLGDSNLLLGVSGVRKTLFLRALHSVRTATLLHRMI